MIHVDEAIKIIQSVAIPSKKESIHFTKALGRVLAEHLYADRDFPPYHRVMMDGIAIDHATFDNGQRKYLIEGVAAAGDRKQTLKKSTHCIEVMTGAILPKGVNVVVRYEDLEINKNVATITIDQTKKWQNIHIQGKDKKEGDCLVTKNRIINAGIIGIATSIGKDFISVKAKPSLLLLSTGNELVNVEEKPAEHQIRKSNVHQIKAVLQSWGYQADIEHINDNKSEIRKKLTDHILQYDAIILSGGVSKGKFDFIPEVLEEIGVKKHFHRVKQRPGKPFWFGTTDQCTVFALPGNPISSFVCTHKYIGQWLLSISELTPNPNYAILAQDLSFKPSLTYFIIVQTKSNEAGQCIAIPQLGNGSGDLANLVNGNAIMELPQNKVTFKKGAVYPIYFIS